MPSTLYFGAPVRRNQTAHREAQDQGLDMMRASPSEVNVTCFKTYAQPGHAIYKQYLPAFIFLSQNPSSRICSRSPIYHPLTSKGFPLTMRMPVVVFHFSREKNSDQITEIITNTGSTETKAGKYAAFRHTIRDNALYQSILQLKPAPLTTTPTGTTEMNIAGFRIYLFLHRLFDAFMRCNQYPGFKTNDPNDVGTFQNFSLLSTSAPVFDSATTSTLDTTVGTAKPSDDSPIDRNMMFHANLEVAAATFNYYITTDNDLSNNKTGLFIPYSTALTKSDYGVIPRVIQRYFLGCLAINNILAQAEFEEIKTSWGNICKTSWGDELAHMYRCIEIALDSQTTMRVVRTSANAYRGIVLYGGMYELHVRHGDENRVYLPVPKDELLQALTNANPHAASLVFIYNNIIYPDEAGRVAARNACTSLRDINTQVLSQGYVTTQEAEMKRRAHLLTFPGGSDYLNVSAHNIITIFTAIADTSISELQFPLHPDAVLSADRAERLLSAFGSEVPSFRVPGGKKMSLEGRFCVRERSATGTPELRDIHTIGAMMLPLKDAFQAFNTMKNEKSVLNPFGSRLATQASTSSHIKKWETGTGDNVIAALRRSVGASANVDAGKGKKRAADEDDLDERSTKRTAAFDSSF